MTNQAPAIELRGVVKEYQALFGAPQRALDCAELVVNRGEGVALLGPNGAGKSTLLWICSGLRRATEGTVRIWGRNPRVASTRSRIGLLPDRPALYPSRTAYEHLELFAAAQGLHNTEAAIAETIGRLDLSAVLHRPVRQLSAGQQKRVALAQALLHRPDLLLLDEPLGALDPESSRLVIDALAEERARGTTLVIATHRLVELAGCCDRVVQVRGGSSQRMGLTPQVLTRLPVRVVYTLPDQAPAPSVGTPCPAPPGVCIRQVSAARRETLLAHIQKMGGAVLHVAPMVDLLSPLPDNEETLA